MNHLVDDLTQDITVETHLKDVEAIMQALLPFHQSREATYRMSFAKRGEALVWGNLARKYDRIDNLAKDTFDGNGNNPGVSLVDTLIDLAMYSLKWVAIIRHIRPDDLQAWIERVYCHDTGMELQDALKLFNAHWSQAISKVADDNLLELGERDFTTMTRGAK